MQSSDIARRHLEDSRFELEPDALSARQVLEDGEERVSRTYERVYHGHGAGIGRRDARHHTADAITQWIAHSLDRRAGQYPHPTCVPLRGRHAIKRNGGGIAEAVAAE